MLPRRLIAALVIVAACDWLAGCQRGESAPRLSDALLIARYAGDVTFTHTRGQEQLHYVVQAEFPADDVLSFIRTELARRNWKPLRNDYFNPSHPSSQVRGWADVADAKPHQAGRQWSAQWQDDNHDIVSYTLEYRADAAGKLDLTTLHVNGVYLPADTAVKAHAAALSAALR